MVTSSPAASLETLFVTRSDGVLPRKVPHESATSLYRCRRLLFSPSWLRSQSRLVSFGPCTRKKMSIATICDNLVLELVHALSLAYCVNFQLNRILGIKLGQVHPSEADNVNWFFVLLSSLFAWLSPTLNCHTLEDVV